ncbi:MAG: DEAD/DEAH box helicase [Bacteroidota bacterium]
MELKPYQQQVVNDLNDFLNEVQTWHRLDLAFEKFWNARGFKVGGPDGMQPYKNTVSGCPHVCIKVPTGGGKTFIACNALRPIFDVMPEGMIKAVAWLVPSNTILEQTVKNLKNPSHPYRQKIESHFNGRVVVYEKEELLQGAGFNATSVREQLSIFVLSYDSIRSNKKDGRKVYQSNGNLDGFVPTYRNPDTLLPDIDESALIQVINQLNPVCIVDESHNAESDLSVEMLRNLNPCFILDLTATPRKNSNIISYVSPLQLKQENMVKLPVVVYNHHSVTDVINDALNLQQKLEIRANAGMEKGGEYIRPMVLFQAQPRSNEDNTTFEKIKQKLIDLGIEPHRIAIKTAEINELKNWDLLDPECPIRYIITVNALKEGWDCSFAYILASLANKASAVDVEQILGRILRQPYAKRHQDQLLNMSYVFTASDRFLDTLENIVKALNKAGFSEKDYRTAEVSPAETQPKPDQPAQSTLPIASENADSEELQLETERITFNPNTSTQNPDQSVEPAMSELESSALTAAKEYENKAKEQNIEDKYPTELGGAMSKSELRDLYKEEALQVHWPEFFVKLPDLTLNWELFNSSENEYPLDKGCLLKGFSLAKSDININFSNTGSPIYIVDTSDEFVPRFEKAAPQIREELLRYIATQPEEVQIKHYTELIFDKIRKIDTLADRDIKNYIKRVIDSLDPDQIGELKENPYRYAEIIKTKISKLMVEHAEAEFYRQLDTDRIFIRETKTFSKTIHPGDKTIAGIKNSLYAEEERGNDFELKVINEVANLDNVLFWHRNLEKKEFAINGFINHYPDYIVLTKRHKVVVIEAKGDDRDNSDSKMKLKLGQAWANKAGSDRYKYFMVFDQNPLDGAYGLDDFLEIMKEL